MVARLKSSFMHDLSDVCVFWYGQAFCRIIVKFWRWITLIFIWAPLPPVMRQRIEAWFQFVIPRVLLFAPNRAELQIWLTIPAGLWDGTRGKFYFLVIFLLANWSLKLLSVLMFLCFLQITVVKLRCVIQKLGQSFWTLSSWR